MRPVLTRMLLYGARPAGSQSRGQTQESSQECSLARPCSSGLLGTETAICTRFLATGAVSSGPSDRESLQEISICLCCSSLASNLRQSSYLWRFQGRHHRILLEHLLLPRAGIPCAHHATERPSDPRGPIPDLQSRGSLKSHLPAALWSKQDVVYS